MDDDDKIYIPAQFELASDLGYLRHHFELTQKLEGLFERDTDSSGSHAETLRESHKEELFQQACKDVARQLLLSEEVLTSIPVSAAQEMVENRYNTYLENPKLAAASRAAAVH